MFDVGCLMMTQHSSVSAENGSDLGRKNLFRLFHLFNGTVFTPLFPFCSYFFPSAESYGSLETIITVSDMCFSDIEPLGLLYVRSPICFNLVESV